MNIKTFTIAAVIAELALFVILSVVLHLEPRAQPAMAAAPEFTGDFQNFTPIRPRPPAPEMPVRDGEGRELGLDRFRGKVVLLNFWATWCAPCVREMPALDRLQAAMGGPDFEVVTVSIDRGGKDVVAPWMAAKQLDNLGIYLDGKSKLMRAFGSRGLPTTYVIDRAGGVAGFIEGPAEWDSDEAKRLVRFYLDEATAD